MIGEIITLIALIILFLVAMANTPKVYEHSGTTGVITMYAFLLFVIIGKLLQILGYIPLTGQH